MAACATGAVPREASASEVAVDGGNYSVKVRSMKELRFARVVRQKYDFSCGSAALATLLTYSYGEPTTEEEAFRAMFAVGDKKHIRKVGFSLLDMKKYLAHIGIDADGYKLTLDQLRGLHVPVITMISPRGYNHFVVLRGWEGDSLVIADPELGMRRMTSSDFAEVWNGIVFVLGTKVAYAQRRYNDEEDSKVLPRSPFGTGREADRAGLSSFFLNLRSFNEY